jgi:hypothetical protein
LTGEVTGSTFAVTQRGLKFSVLDPNAVAETEPNQIFNEEGAELLEFLFEQSRIGACLDLLIESARPLPSHGDIMSGGMSQASFYDLPIASDPTPIFPDLLAALADFNRQARCR